MDSYRTRRSLREQKRFRPGGISYQVVKDRELLQDLLDLLNAFIFSCSISLRVVHRITTGRAVLKKCSEKNELSAGLHFAVDRHTHKS
jgi:hypothetical protein